MSELKAEEIKPCGCRNDMKSMCFYHSENGGWTSPDDIELSQERIESIWKAMEHEENNPEEPNVCKVCKNDLKSEIHDKCRRDRVEAIRGKCSCGGSDTTKEAFEKTGAEFFSECGNCNRYIPAENFNPDPEEVQAILRSRK